MMLKDYPKWKPNTPLPRSLKKTKINDIGTYISLFNAATSLDINNNDVEVSLIGQKTGKAKVKAMKK